jgi:hypothetical protein
MKTNPRYGTLKAAAEFSGLSIPSLRKLIAKGILIPYKPIGRIFLDLSALEVFMRNSARRRMHRGEGLARYREEQRATES